MFAYYFLKKHLHHSSKIKSHKKVTKSRNRGLFFLFFLDDGRIRIHIQIRIRIPTNNDGSGSGRPKNLQILRIRIDNSGLNIQTSFLLQIMPARTRQVTREGDVLEVPYLTFMGAGIRFHIQICRCDMSNNH